MTTFDGHAFWPNVASILIISVDGLDKPSSDPEITQAT